MTTPYTIPNLGAEMRKFRKLWLMVPGVTLAACAYGYYLRGMSGLYDLLALGFFGGVVLTVPVFGVLVVIYFRKQKAIWAEHTFEWYRKTFPEHAHAKGRVSCRHCGGEHVRVERLMNHTYMRTHACGQCGQTLYFSTEQR